MTLCRTYPSTRQALTLIACWTLGAVLMAVAASARPVPSTDLLLPYFEIDLGGGRTTYFAVVNASREPVDVKISVFSNWGIEVMSTTTTLRGEEARTADLADWLRGQLPGKTIDVKDLEHYRAALSGQRSPRDDLYYSTEVAFQRAVGYVKIAVVGGPRPAVLFGDYFVVDPSGDLAHGDVLVDVAHPLESRELCRRHGVRFLNGGFDEGTEILIWSDHRVAPSESAYFPAQDKAAAALDVFRQDGAALERRDLDVLPLTMLKVGELGVAADFGWLDLATAEDSFVAVRYAARERYSVGLQTFCLPPAAPAPQEESKPQPPEIEIETSINGDAADFAPGPDLTDGSPIRWTYRVTNVGSVRLFLVAVTDDQGVDVSCPRASLNPGETMECFGQGFATSGQHRNLGTATGRSGLGDEASASDASYYFGSGPPEWDE